MMKQQLDQFSSRCAMSLMLGISLLCPSILAQPQPLPDSNFEVLTGGFAYLPPLDSLKPYGDLSGKAWVTRTSRGSTLFTAALHINETASLPPQTAVNIQYFHGSCDAISKGYNVQVQDPATCPWSPLAATCTTGEVALVPLLEAQIQGNIDATGRVITAYDWPVYLPSTPGPFSMVVFDPSFPPGYFKMACADLVSDRSMSTEVVTVPTDIISTLPPATLTADITYTDLGATSVRVRVSDFGSFGLYEFALRALPCGAGGTAATPFYQRTLDCNLIGGAAAGLCDTSDPENIVSGIFAVAEDVLTYKFSFDFLARADGEAIVFFKCSTLSPPGGCVRESETPFTCLDFAQHADLPESTTTTTTTPEPDTMTTTVDPLYREVTTTQGSKDGGGVVSTTEDTNRVPEENENGGESGGSNGVCGSDFESIDELCCLPMTPSSDFFGKGRAGAISFTGQSSEQSSEGSDIAHILVISASSGFFAVILVAGYLNFSKSGSRQQEHLHRDSDMIKDDSGVGDEEYAVPSLLSSAFSYYGTTTSAPLDYESDSDDVVKLNMPSTPERCSAHGLRSRTPPGKDLISSKASDLVYEALETSALLGGR